MHERKRILGEEYRAHEKKFDGGAPVSRICVREQFGRRAAGVGNANIEPAEALLNRGDKLRNGVLIGDIDGLMESFAAR